MNINSKARKLVLLATLSSCASIPSTQPPPYTRLHESNSMEHVRLANGAEVVLVVMPQSKSIVFSANYRVGAAEDPAGQSGLAHLFEHVASRRTRHFPNLKQAIQQKAEYFNAATSADGLSFVSRMPADPDRLRFIAEMEATRLYDLDIQEADLEAERSTVINEIIGHGEMRGRDRKQLLQPYGYNRNPAGVISEVKAIPIQRIQEFYERNIVPERLFIVVTGNFDRANALATITRHFSRPKDGFRDKESAVIETRPSQLMHSGSESIALLPPRLCAWQSAAQLGLSLWNGGEALESIRLKRAGYVAFTESQQNIFHRLTDRESDVSPPFHRLNWLRTKAMEQLVGDGRDPSLLNRSLRDGGFAGHVFLPLWEREQLARMKESDVAMALLELRSYWLDGKPCESQLDKVERRNLDPSGVMMKKVGVRFYFGDMSILQAHPSMMLFLPDLMRLEINRSPIFSGLSIGTQGFDPRHPNSARFTFEASPEDAHQIPKAIQSLLELKTISSQTLQSFQKDQIRAIEMKRRQPVHAAVRELMGVKYGRGVAGRLNVFPSYEEELALLKALRKDEVEAVLATVDPKSLEQQSDSDPSLWRPQYPEHRRSALFTPIHDWSKAIAKPGKKSIRTYPGSGPHALVFASVIRKSTPAFPGQLERIHEGFKQDLEGSLRTRSGLAYHYISELDANDSDVNASFAVLVLCTPEKCEAIERTVRNLLVLPRFKTIVGATRVIELIPKKAYSENTSKPQAM